MNATKFFIFILLITMFGISAYGQNIKTRGRVSNSVYVYDDSLEKAYIDASTGATEYRHVRLYQTLRFQAIAPDWKNLTFSLNARALTDLNPDVEMDSDRRFNAYRLSLKASGLFNNILDFELGRQFLHPGVVLGSLDGLNLTLRPLKALEWQLYGGVESHLFKSMQIYNPDDATIFGTGLTYRNLYQTDLQLVYLQRMRSGESQWNLAGINVKNASVNDLLLLLQAHYDLENARFHRLYLSSRYNLNTALSAGLYLKQHYPQVYADSYFQIFDIRQYRLVGGNIAWAFTDRYAVNAALQSVMLEEGYGNRVFLTLSDPNGNLGFVFETGDLGDQIGVLFDYGYEVVPDLLASVSVDYSRYRFEEVYEYEKQLANAARLSYTFSRHWRADLEYQWMTNRVKDSDQRLLNHIHFIW